MHVLIPAYEPDQRLVELIDDLFGAALVDTVIVVDDGSGPAYGRVFEAVRERGAMVIRHPVNRGKGCALKTGFLALAGQGCPDVVVCADADGQHSVLDVAKVGAQVSRTGRMALGARGFTGSVPLRSRIGNDASRVLVSIATRRRWRDTQAGLRGYPGRLLPWLLQVPGERYEYETALLLAAARAGLPVDQVDIATIYLAGNASSHFRPVADSVRVWGPVLAFAAVSFGSFLLDAGLLLAFHAITGSLLVSVVLSRVISATVNFLANRHLVFGSRRRSLSAAAWRYWLLATALLGANYLLLSALTAVGASLPVAKILTESALFVVSYLTQRLVVFRSLRARSGRAASGSTQIDHAFSGDRS